MRNTATKEQLERVFYSVANEYTPISQMNESNKNCMFKALDYKTGDIYEIVSPLAWKEIDGAVVRPNPRLLYRYADAKKLADSPGGIPLLGNLPAAKLISGGL